MKKLSRELQHIIECKKNLKRKRNDSTCTTYNGKNRNEKNNNEIVGSHVGGQVAPWLETAAAWAQLSRRALGGAVARDREFSFAAACSRTGSAAPAGRVQVAKTNSKPSHL